MIDWEKIRMDLQKADVLLESPHVAPDAITSCSTCGGRLLYPGTLIVRRPRHFKDSFFCRDCGYAYDPAYYEKRWPTR